MPDSLGNIDQVAGLNLDGEHRATLGMDVEESRPLEDESDLVLRMGMFTFEFFHHRVEVRGGGTHLHHIGRDVSARLLEPVDLRLVSGENVFGGSIRADALLQIPSFMPDSKRLQESAYGFGTLGCALPMAIGASIAAPERPVLAIAGDGGWLFTVAEMAAAVDEDANVTLVLWDNRGYQQIRQSFDDVSATRMGVDVSSYDPLAIARGFGWSARDVTSPDDLGEALRDAFRGGQQMLRICVPAN